MVQTIAIVDDSADMRLLVAAILGSAYSVVEYEDGESALIGLRASRPDLMVLDITLPGMSGTDVVREIRADVVLRTLPVVALTGHAADADRERLLAAGFQACVTKPITDFSLLQRVVANALAARVPG